MKEKPSLPTLYDVADLSGVSTATVSRCLNAPDQVSEKTREKVMSAVSKLGYSPNFAAKAMAARRTNTIGAIIPTMENAVFARGLQAFQETLWGHGFTLLVASSSYRRDVEEEHIKSLVARGADALLLIGHDRDPEIYHLLDTQNVPSLITWAFQSSAPRPSVGFDNKSAMQSLAGELIALGHHDLALISADMTRNDRARERKAGIDAAMKDAGLSPDDLKVIVTPYGIENGAMAFETLMTKAQKPTAVFCGNDVLAVGALRRAREMGLRVPQDVSITGFDDIELAQVTHPALTTVHVPHRQMGRRAATMLVDLLQNNTAPSPVELSAKLVLRGSHGPKTAR